ncbi:MAG: glycosyltransferase [Planctomycetes bacterium]|nr:glycosyltransferase [Planctomycetota bacterium]
MPTPVVSILTSCYNAAEFLPEAIESILGQTFKDFEFILIDDGSTDNTLNIISGYAAKDDRIILIEKKNTGLTDSLNVGIRKARGKLIARMDADDISFPDRLEKQITYLQKQKDVILLGTGCIEIDRIGRNIKQHRYSTGHKSLIRCFEKGGSPFPHSSVIYKTETVRQIDGYRDRLNGAEDFDLWLRMSLIGKIRCLSEPLIRLRKHAVSITARDEKSVILSYVVRLSHYLRKHGYPDPVEQDEKAYQTFLSWLEKRLIEEHVLQIRQFCLNLRKEWYCRDINILLRSAQLIMRLISSPYKFKFLHQKILGSALAARLTNEWIRINTL